MFAVPPWLMFCVFFYLAVRIGPAGVIYSLHPVPFDGKKTTYWPNGKIKEENNYKDGHIQGRSAAWAENGQLLSDWNYNASIPVDGERKQFWSSGALNAVENRKDGKAHGLSTYYHENGNKASEIEYDGGREMHRIDYGKDGRKKEEVYKGPDGKELKQISYNQNGVVTQQSWV